MGSSLIWSKTGDGVLPESEWKIVSNGTMEREQALAEQREAPNLNAAYDDKPLQEQVLAYLNENDGVYSAVQISSGLRNLKGVRANPDAVRSALRRLGTRVQHHTRSVGASKNGWSAPTS
jgi:hypothetical protein